MDKGKGKKKQKTNEQKMAAKWIRLMGLLAALHTSHSLPDRMSVRRESWLVECVVCRTGSVASNASKNDRPDGRDSINRRPPFQRKILLFFV